MFAAAKARAVELPCDQERYKTLDEMGKDLVIAYYMAHGMINDVYKGILTKDSDAACSAEIEAEAAVHRQSTGSQVLGASAVRGQHPHDRPEKSKKSPAPLFHAAREAVRRELYEMYGWFVAAFREASEKLRGGNRMVKFPSGSFPPALPFVAG